MKMKVVERLMDPAAATGRKTAQIPADEIVAPGKKPTADKYGGILRRVTAAVETQGRMKTMTFPTNNLKWSARTVAEIYRDRWGIETFFKEPRQTGWASRVSRRSCAASSGTDAGSSRRCGRMGRQVP